MHIRQRLLFVLFTALLMSCGWAIFGPVRPANALPAGRFVAPLPTPLTVIAAFDPPPKPWLPGNRGVDLAATTGESVVAAADGVVIYAGLLAGRGVVSINHGIVRTTYEPVDPIVARGTRVRRGQVVGSVSAINDDCGPPGRCLHWGAIRDDTYIDPLSLLAATRVRLLPVWTNRVPDATGPLPEAAAATSAWSAQALESSAHQQPTSTAATVAARTAVVSVVVGGAAATALRGLRRRHRPHRKRSAP